MAADPATKRRRKPPTAPLPRKRGRPQLADRERLLDAAEGVIRRSGPQVSLERIAAAADVTKPALFAYVGDRRALVHALADRLLARMEAAVQAALTGGRDARDALGSVIAAYLATVSSDRHLYAFVNGAGGAGDTTHASTLAFARRSAAPLVAGIAEARARAGRDPSVAEPWGYAIIGALHMVGIWWVGEPARELEAARLAGQLTDLLWSGLAPPA